MPSGVQRRALVLVIALAGALRCQRIALAGNGGLLPPVPHSPNAHRIKDTYLFVLAFTGVVFLIVEGVLIAFVVEYRRGKRARESKARRFTARRGWRSSGRSCPS